MYNLLLRYEYVLVAAAALLVLLPLIALPDKDTRAAFVPAVRARTLRVDADDVVRAAVVLPRVVTPRDATPRVDVAAFVVVPRDATTGRVDTPRETVCCDVVRAVDMVRDD